MRLDDRELKILSVLQTAGRIAKGPTSAYAPLSGVIVHDNTCYVLSGTAPCPIPRAIIHGADPNWRSKQWHFPASLCM